MNTKDSNDNSDNNNGCDNNNQYHLKKISLLL